LRSVWISTTSPQPTAADADGHRRGPRALTCTSGGSP
jgi:hypothetical protein